MLEMRGICDRCESALSDDGPAVICRFEFMFCTACGSAMSHLCPNCGGELVTRLRRSAS